MGLGGRLGGEEVQTGGRIAVGRLPEGVRVSVRWKNRYGRSTHSSGSSGACGQGVGCGGLWFQRWAIPDGGGGLGATVGMVLRVTVSGPWRLGGCKGRGSSFPRAPESLSH